MTGLNEQRIPPDLLPQARTWFDKEIRRLEQLHGDAWPNTRDWIADYLNAEIAERVDARRTQ